MRSYAKKIDPNRKKNEPKAIQNSIRVLRMMGYRVVWDGNSDIRFFHNGCAVIYYPYKQWATGASIDDCRGFETLIIQLANTFQFYEKV